MMVPYTGIPPSTGTALAGRRMGMVIDLNRCREDCTACLDACRKENNVAFHGDKELDIHWIRRVDVRRKVSVKDEADRVKKVLLLCFHCENPPCAQVCPVQATYQREDGIVIVDQHRCIGCRYCMIACPYAARFFNFKENPKEWEELNKDRPMRSHGVAEGCTMCAHRLDVDKDPACVEACHEVGADAIHCGDLNNPDSGVSTMIAAGGAMRLREDLGTEPKVFYLGL
jgi:molybdopterin-containing oxidoreductase family iron-sulfur binding subunit